jgi:hypothetical protein
MAKPKNSVVTHGLSGMSGDLPVFRDRCLNQTRGTDGLIA